MRMETSIKFDEFDNVTNMNLPLSERGYGRDYIRTVNIVVIDKLMVDVAVWNTSGWKVNKASSSRRYKTPQEALEAYVKEVNYWLQYF